MKAAEILTYWFGEEEDSATYRKERGALWFGGKPATDREIKQRFELAVQAAAHGEFDGWRREPRSALALVLLLDQFPLNIYRNLAESFRLCDLALPAALEALDREFHLELNPREQSFLYLCLEHAENKEHQARSVALFTQSLEEQKGSGWEPWARSNLDYALRHQRVVERFGRFPHRNRALGRVSTSAELEFLSQGRWF